MQSNPQLQEGRIGVRRGSIPENAPSPIRPPTPLSPFGAALGSTMITVNKVVCEPLNLAYAEKKVQV